MSLGPTSSETARGASESLDPSALSGPWLGSFETGLDDAEQLWLLPASGAPVSVMPPNEDPYPYGGRSSDGYYETSGYVSETLFDATQERLIVSSQQASGSLIRSLDLTTARWSTIHPPAAQTALRDSERGAVILAIDGTLLTVIAAVGPALESVAQLTLDPENPLSFAHRLQVRRYVFGGADRILIIGDGYAGPILHVGHFERSTSGWVPVASPVSTSTELDWVDTSEDSTRLCFVGGDGSGWLVSPANVSELPVPFAARQCKFSPDGSRVWFSEYEAAGGKVWIADRNGSRLAEFDNLAIHASQGGFAYGTNRKSLLRLDWSSLELETLPSPAWCKDYSGDGLGFDSGEYHQVHLVGSVAVVENYCLCIDCHFSGVYVLPLSGTAPAQRLIEPTEWDILQLAPLADGSLVIAQSRYQTYGVSQRPPGADRFVRFTPDGQVTELGPFPGLPVPVHAPVGPRAQ